MYLDIQNAVIFIPKNHWIVKSARCILRGHCMTFLLFVVWLARHSPNVSSTYTLNNNAHCIPYGIDGDDVTNSTNQ